MDAAGEERDQFRGDEAGVGAWLPDGSAACGCFAEKSFILRQLDWRATPYFTLMVISRQLAIPKCFRVPFVTRMGRDALVVHIPVFNPGERTEIKESLRLCTTHLESLWKERAIIPVSWL